MDKTVKQKLDHFFGGFAEEHLEKGQFIIFGGENPSGIFYLTRGLVRQYAISASGEEVVVNIYKPPAFFPMNWAVNKTPNKYFFQTMQPSSFHKAPAEKVLEFIKQNPDVMLDLLSRLYSGLNGVLEQNVQLMSGSARARIALELIIACKRFGQPDAAGAYELKISQQELASRVGLSRETISRDLKDMPGISVIHGGIRVKDLSRLELLLNQESAA